MITCICIMLSVETITDCEDLVHILKPEGLLIEKWKQLMDC